MASGKKGPQLVSAQITPKKPQGSTPASSQGEVPAKKAIAAKARKPPKSDVELKRNAIKSNPPGVRIFNANLENSKAVMAGYLNLKDTNALAQLIAREDNAGLLAEFQESRRAGFGIVDRNDASNWSCKAIFECIVGASPAEQALFDQPTIPIKHHQLPGTTIKSTSPGYLTWINVMHRLILQNRDCFEDDVALSPYMGPHTAEDWFRAYSLIRHHHRTMTLTVKQSKSNARGPMNLAAESPKFLVAADFRASASTGETDETTAVNSEDNSDSDEGGEGDGDLSDIAEELQDKIERAYEEGALTMSAGGDLNAVTKDCGRPPLTRVQVGRFLKSEGKKVRVLHDVGKNPKDEVSQKVIQAADAAKSFSAVELDDLENNTHNRERQEFWKVMDDVSAVSVKTAPYLDCCRELNIDPDSRAFGDNNQSFQPWQVIGIHQMLSMEASLLGGGINACDCGTGKTVTCLGLIEQSAKRQAEAVAKGTLKRCFRFRPTLVACPSQLVDVWYDDWNRFFNGPDRLVFKQFYGSEAIITNPVRKATLLGTKLKDLTDYLATLSPEDPATARVVIVSAYSTWHRRTLMAEEAWMMDDPQGKGKGKEEAVAEEDDEGYEPDDDDETATANPTMVYTSSLKHQFWRVICDEAHALKNRRTLTHLAIKHLIAPKMWFISATPMINHVKDLGGYLSLLWKDGWTLGSDWDAEEFYSEEVDLSLLLDAANEDDSRAALITAVTKGQNIFQLNPRKYNSLANHDKADFVLIGKALRAILSQIQLRHTMATVIDMGNGKTLRIGENIPHYRVTTVELGMSPAQSLRYAQVWERHVGSLYTLAPDDENPSSSEELTGRLNLVIHRRLVHATLNLHLESLVFSVGKKSLVKDINRWYDTANDFGATHFFRHTRPAKYFRPYQDRLSMAEYMSGLSVKMQYMCYLIHNICIDEVKRVQVVVDMPMNQWIIEAFLVNLGLNVLSLRSAHSHADRRETIRAFNDPTYPVDVLVTNFRTSSLGVNLQGCCSKTIIMDTAANVNTIIQTIGRIHRLGQKEIQDVYIITVDHTYDQILQAKATNKMIAQLAGEARTTGNSKEEMEANAEQLITKILGQRCSRKDWLDLDLKVKDKLKQEPFCTSEKLLRDRENKDKLQQQTAARAVLGRTRASTKVNSRNGVAETAASGAAKSTSSDIPDLDLGGGDDDTSNAQPSLTGGNESNDRPGKETDDATLLEEEDPSLPISHGDNSAPPGSESGVCDTLPETPRTDIGDDATAPNSEFDNYNPLLSGTSRAGYEDDSMSHNSDSEARNLPLPKKTLLLKMKLPGRVNPGDIEDSIDSNETHSEDLSSAEKLGGKQDSKGRGKGKKRKAVESGASSDSLVKRSRRNKSKVDYTEKMIDDDI